MKLGIYIRGSTAHVSVLDSNNEVICPCLSPVDDDFMSFLKILAKVVKEDQYAWSPSKP